jgi:hypothetical protein
VYHLKEEDHFEDKGIEGRILPKLLNRLGGRTWSRLNWFRTKDSAVFWKQVVNKTKLLSYISV